MDDFDRDVYCMLGLPFDAVDMKTALERIRFAANNGTRCFLSTPNLNFLIGCRNDPAFRDSVINSDLSVADGMPLIWMARLIGLPLPERVAGAGLFERLRAVSPGDEGPMRVYFFGGPPGAAEGACTTLNASPSGVRCVGWQSPGFEPIESMSGPECIEAINTSKADFLVVALGARKGQGWIRHNLDRLTVPVVSHLGAVVNFAAGTVARAPVWMQRVGLEWLWRIKEEPGLWRRYWHDGVVLAGWLFKLVVPYSIKTLRERHGSAVRKPASISLVEQDEARLLEVGGWVPDSVPTEFRRAMRAAARDVDRPVVVNLSGVERLGAGFIGQMLMLMKNLPESSSLKIVGLSEHVRKEFKWCGAEYLLPRACNEY